MCSKSQSTWCVEKQICGILLLLLITELFLSLVCHFSAGEKHIARKVVQMADVVGDGLTRGPFSNMKYDKELLAEDVG